MKNKKEIVELEKEYQEKLKKVLRNPTHGLDELASYAGTIWALNWVLERHI